MKAQRKEFYESPATDVVEIKTRGGILAFSDPKDYTNGGDPFNPVSE